MKKVIQKAMIFLETYTGTSPVNPAAIFGSTTMSLASSMEMKIDPDSTTNEPPTRAYKDITVFPLSIDDKEQISSLELLGSGPSTPDDELSFISGSSSSDELLDQQMISYA